MVGNLRRSNTVDGCGGEKPRGSPTSPTVLCRTSIAGATSGPLETLASAQGASIDRTPNQLFFGLALICDLGFPYDWPWSRAGSTNATSSYQTRP